MREGRTQQLESVGSMKGLKKEFNMTAQDPKTDYILPLNDMGNNSNAKEEYRRRTLNGVNVSPAGLVGSSKQNYN